MSGKVLYQPDRPHRCDLPRSAADGTVVECDCGKVWVAHPSRYANVFMPEWYSETRRQRRKRLKRDPQPVLTVVEYERREQAAFDAIPMPISMAPQPTTGEP